MFVCPGGSTPVSGGLTSEQGKVNGPDSLSRHCVPLQMQILACDSLLRSLRRRAPGDLFSFPYHTLSTPRPRHKGSLSSSRPVSAIPARPLPRALGSRLATPCLPAQPRLLPVAPWLNLWLHILQGPCPSPFQSAGASLAKNGAQPTSPFPPPS